MKVRPVWSRALAVVAVIVVGVFSAHAQSPAFRVDPYWPKPLPNNWIIGQVGGMAIDAQDNIWVFQRPRSLTDDEKGAALNPPRSKCCVPAPSVLVFDQAGNVVKSWGGPGDNSGYDWPRAGARHPRRQQRLRLAVRQWRNRQYGAEIHDRRKVRQTARQEGPAHVEHRSHAVRPRRRSETRSEGQ